MRRAYTQGSHTAIGFVDDIRVKAIPSDFCVTEALALPPEAGSTDIEQSFRYFRLRKCGYTTFQAIEAISSFFELQRAEVTYCGLKDEDGITDQMVAIPFRTGPSDVSHFNEMHTSAGEFISLTFYGCYGEPLTVGLLEGNAFRIRVRKVAPHLARCLEGSRRTFQQPIINYYDTQRFGVPGAPKTTHLVGEALLAENYSRALSILHEAGTPESQHSREFDERPEEFFHRLDPRVTAFYMSAHSSFLWNEVVADALQRRLPAGQLAYYQRDGLSYVVPRSSHHVSSALASTPSFEYRRYSLRDHKVSFTPVERPTVLNLALQIRAIAPDELFSGFYRVDLSFLLPSGSYATNVVTQFFLALAFAVAPPYDKAEGANG